MRKLKILFISHSYPPTLGGVESQNYNLAQSLKKISETKIIANGRGKVWLPIFIPITFIRAFFLMYKYDACLVGNGVLAPVAALLKIFHQKKKFFSVVHGLDITYCQKKGLLPRIYKDVNIPSLKVLDKLFMVGNFTIDEAEKAGIPEDHCVFIPNGVNVLDLKKKYDREELCRILGCEVKGKKVIMRLARFVPHKGTDWFIKNVMTRLPEDVIMVATGYRVDKKTAGDPDNFEDCEKAIKEFGLDKRVFLLPTLPQKDLEVLLNTVDLVVSPNVNYPGSSEGFGINVIEAGACDRVVLASNLQGLADAVKDGQNGFLITPEDAGQWISKINDIFHSGDNFTTTFGQQAGKFVANNYSWEKISKRYLEEIQKCFPH